MRELAKQEIESAIACLRNIKTRRGWSQMQLAEMSGVNQSTISKIFSGETGATYENVKKLCHALGLRVDDVLGERGEPVHDLCGYLATPLTGLTAKTETEVQKIVERVRHVAHQFRDPLIDIYWPGDHTHPTRNPNFRADEVYLLDRSRASAHDFAVLLCAAPSYGVGQENEIATQAGLPAIRIVPAKMSRMMSGSFLQAVDVLYEGSLENGIRLDEAKLRAAFEDLRPVYFKHRALYRNLNGNAFGPRLKKLIDERSGGYKTFAKELGVSLQYVHALMDENLVVSNPSVRLLKRMALLLCTSVGFLLGEHEEADPVFVESKASWKKWIAGAQIQAGAAVEIWDEWVDQYRQEQNQLTTASFRRSSRPLAESDWELRRKQRLKKDGANASGQLFQ